jgi:hypothetical protein
MGIAGGIGTQCFILSNNYVGYLWGGWGAL